MAAQTIEALSDELDGLEALRSLQGWDKYWKDCMKFALPQDVSYDSLLNSGTTSQITGVMATGVTKRTKTLYDQTSLWAIERLTAGLISLKTPEGANWHKLTADDPFGYEPTLAEEAWYDRLTRYLFKVRGNPQTGFWPAHKAAVRSTAALGDGFYFIEENFGDVRTPFRYEFVPLGECFVSVDMAGRILRFYRVRYLTAEQIVGRWGDRASGKVKKCANDVRRKNDTFKIAHAVVPRQVEDTYNQMGVMGAPWRGVYFECDTKHQLDESGYWEMPYVQHSWNRTAGRAYSEGPLALALAEVKSLNEMAKNELISSQQAVRPPLATFGEQFTRVNLNPGAANKGLISGDGKLLVQPIMTHTRPDFAQQVLETRRNMVREMLYLNLWQVLIERPDMTATEALLRNQEKGELLGPVGLNFNTSLSAMTEREIAILARKGAFQPGAPLEAPDEIMDRGISPIFTAPLDRMRAMDEVVGAQRTVAGMIEVAAVDPERGQAMMQRVNLDRYADILRKGNGAPADLFYTDEEVQADREASQNAQQLAQTIELMKAGGEAAGAIGTGTQALQQSAGPSAAVTNALAA